MTLDEFFNGFLKRSKSQWRGIFDSSLSKLRNWINDSPEVAFFAAFFLGLTVALAFKFFFFLGTILVLIGAVIYYFAPAE